MFQYGDDVRNKTAYVRCAFPLSAAVQRPASSGLQQRGATLLIYLLLCYCCVNNRPLETPSFPFSPNHSFTSITSLFGFLGLFLLLKLLLLLLEAFFDVCRSRWSHDGLLAVLALDHVGLVFKRTAGGKGCDHFVVDGVYERCSGPGGVIFLVRICEHGISCERLQRAALSGM